MLSERREKKSKIIGVAKEKAKGEEEMGEKSRRCWALLFSSDKTISLFFYFLK